MLQRGFKQSHSTIIPQTCTADAMALNVWIGDKTKLCGSLSGNFLRNDACLSHNNQNMASQKQACVERDGPTAVNEPTHSACIAAA